MKWLITGGCGFLGRALANDLLTQEEHRIRILDNLSVGTRGDLAEVAPFSECDLSSDPREWAERLSLIEGDILDPKVVDWAVSGADVVVHLAANTGVPQSVESPRADCEVNVFGTLNVLEGMRKAGGGRFVFASSGAPLGEQIPPLHEEMAPHPASPYGASKLAGEGYCSAYFHCYGIETVVLRFGNVYGEGAHRKGSVVAKFIKQAMAGEKLEIYGDGTQTRDYIHISDLVAAMRKAAETPGIGGEVFQIATSSETTMLELTDKLLHALKAEGVNVPEVFHGEPRTGDVRRNYSDTGKALRMLGWQAEVPLEEGLRRTVRYFKALQQA